LQLDDAEEAPAKIGGLDPYFLPSRAAAGGPRGAPLILAVLLATVRHRMAKPPHIQLTDSEVRQPIEFYAEKGAAMNVLLRPARNLGSGTENRSLCCGRPTRGHSRSRATGGQDAW
jgi:hypothetical protein